MSLQSFHCIFCFTILSMEGSSWGLKILEILATCCLFFVFQDRVSLYSTGCPGTHSVDQAGLKLRIPPASASQSAGITGVRRHHPAVMMLSYLQVLQETKILQNKLLPSIHT